MGFFRDNILKFAIIFVVVIIFTIGFSFMFSKKKTVDESYGEMENNLKQAAINYVNVNRQLLPKEEGTLKKVNLDTLVNAKKIKEMHAVEDSNSVCTGYVTIVMKNKEYLFKPYIKCGRYYETTTIAQHIQDNEKIVSQEDGLYKIDNKLVYKGEDPKNYIMLGERMYRIMEINEDNELKLISSERFDEYTTWDDRYNSEREDYSGINNFSKSRLKDFLNSIYKSDFFTDSDRAKIAKHDICVGKKSLSDTSIDGRAECSVVEKNQYVGIIQTNEFMRASIDSGCKSSNNPECVNYNYLYNVSNYLRTQNAVADNTYEVYYIDAGVASTTMAENNFTIYPVIYLDKDVLYKKGTGTLKNPYVVK